MKQSMLRCVIFVLTVAAIGAFSFVPAIFAQGSAGAAGPQVTSDQCLTCHGPFEKLSSAPPFYTAPSGEKINPHRYVPHDLKDVPDCVSCHKPHSATPTTAEIAALPKPNVTSCFECHHTKTFQNCEGCHKKD